MQSSHLYNNGTPTPYCKPLILYDGAYNSTVCEANIPERNTSIKVKSQETQELFRTWNSWFLRDFQVAAYLLLYIGAGLAQLGMDQAIRSQCLVIARVIRLP
jgi:hypothetical protein